LIDTGDIIVICVIVKVACEGIAFSIHPMLGIIWVFGLYIDLNVEVFDLVYLNRVTFEITCWGSFLGWKIGIEADFVQAGVGGMFPIIRLLLPSGAYVSISLKLFRDKYFYTSVKNKIKNSLYLIWEEMEVPYSWTKFLSTILNLPIHYNWESFIKTTGRNVIEETKLCYGK
jgi:hypothetical protein